jgi:hypothetical protein
MAPLTIVIEYDPSYTDDELDELERELIEAGVSAQLQQRSPRMVLGELAVGLLVFVGSAAGQKVVSDAMDALVQAVRSARRRRTRLKQIDRSATPDAVADAVMFEFNRHRVVVRGDELDNLTALELLAVTSRVVESGQGATTWVWDPAIRDLRRAEGEDGR